MPRTVTKKTGAHLAVVPAPEVVNAELIEEMTKAEAESITLTLRDELEHYQSIEDNITELALKAYYGQAFRALGYATWDAYAKARFGDLELPRPAQAAVNAALINTGQISARSAAAISGTSDKTASADAAKVASSTAESSAVGKQRTGADGKKRAARKPRQSSQRQPATTRSWRPRKRLGGRSTSCGRPRRGSTSTCCAKARYRRRARSPCPKAC